MEKVRLGKMRWPEVCKEFQPHAARPGVVVRPVRIDDSEFGDIRVLSTVLAEILALPAVPVARDGEMLRIGEVRVSDGTFRQGWVFFRLPPGVSSTGVWTARLREVIALLRERELCAIEEANEWFWMTEPEKLALLVQRGVAPEERDKLTRKREVAERILHG